MSDARERFLRLNPARTEKAVHAIQTLAATGNNKNYDYTEEEAQACFSAIEDAARELYEAFGLDRGIGTPEAVQDSVQETVPRLESDRRRVTIVRSKIDRARAYIRDGKLDDALKALNGALQEAP